MKYVMTFRAGTYQLQDFCSKNRHFVHIVQLFIGNRQLLRCEKKPLTPACLYGSFNIAHLKLLVSHAEVGCPLYAVNFTS